MKKYFRIVLAFTVIGLMVCGFSLSVFSASVVPVLFENWQSGNAQVECAEAGCNAEFFLKIDEWDQVNGMDDDYNYYSDPDAEENEWPYHDNTITITNSNGQTFDWASLYPVTCIIVKGGPGANVFYYPGGAYSDTYLYAPTNPNNNQLFDISHVTFCFNRPEDAACYRDETAWAFGGPRANPNWNYAQGRNWGWTNGPLGEGKYEFALYAGAGQNDLSKGMPVGKVYVDYSGGCVTVKYETVTDVYLGETHLWVGSDPLPKLRQGRTEVYTNAPGQFPYGISINFGEEKLNEWEWKGCNFKGDIYVAAHAVVWILTDCAQ